TTPSEVFLLRDYLKSDSNLELVESKQVIGLERRGERSGIPFHTLQISGDIRLSPLQLDKS
ncbi:21138_t:CDS:1, partial [Gigaspora rosea]